jgi:hypothetical protein
MERIKIGWAIRDISTTEPVGIPGQFNMRISTGVRDPLMVTALVLDNAEDSVIFLSADLVVIRWFLLDRIREKIAAANPDIPVLKILMNATHAHTGADHYDESEEFPCDLPRYSGTDYREFLATQAADAVTEAWAKRKAGGVAWGYGHAVVAYSRLVVYFDDTSKRQNAQHDSTHGVDGHARMYGNTSDPMFSHFEAGADHFVNLLFTFDEKNKLTGAVVNIPCPSQVSESEWTLSADYWHDVRVAIRKEYGDIFILPQCAASGDLSPHILHYKQALARHLKLKGKSERQDIAERIGSAIAEVLDWAKNDVRTELPIRHVVETVSLSRRMITKEEYEDDKRMLAEYLAEPFATEGTPKERLFHDSVLNSKRQRAKTAIARYESQVTDPKLPMELHVIKIGDVAFASNRFEMYMDYMHRIQARSPFEQTFVVQLAGVPGVEGGTYLPTERGIWGRGYSASRYCNQVGPEGGQELVEETVKLLNQIGN